MHNAVIWGFDGHCKESIKQLEAQRIIDIKAWFTVDPSVGPSYYPKNEFFKQNWLDTYREAYDKYTSDYQHDAGCYAFIYNKIGHLVSTYSRYDYDNRIFNEFSYYIHAINMFYKFFYSMIKHEKIDLLIFHNIPHAGSSDILYFIAKFLKIPTVILLQSSISKKFFYMFDIDNCGDFPDMTQICGNDYIEIPRQHFTDLPYMRDLPSNNPGAAFKFMLRGSLRPKGLVMRYKKYSYFLSLFTRHDENLKKYTVVPDYERKFVYFPLHLQPELTTSALGGKYNDQILAIERIAELIPDDWLIYVKENPKQTGFMRPDIFFERLALVKKARLLNMEENTFKLMQNSQFVATITGTVGWEAIKGGKCALVFGAAWYQTLPGVFKYHDNFKLSEIINYTLEHKVFEQEANKLFNRMWSGVIDTEYETFFEDYSKDESVLSVTECLKMCIDKVSKA